MIEFNDVHKRYGAIRALDGVSFSIGRGEVFGYIGPNGAGKTTSIKILTGLIRDYDGSVLVDGTPIEQDRASLHRRIGYLPQTAGFQEWRTVRHALETFGRLSGLEKVELDDRIEEVTSRLGLVDHRDRRIVHLSGGMQQRLRFAQAIIHRPEIIILDEPLSGLDPSSRAELKRTIRSLALENHTIILSSHVLSDVEDLATRIAILDHGRVRDTGTREELRDRHGVGSLIEVHADEPRENAGALGSLAAIERVQAAGGDGLIAHVHAGVAMDEAMHQVLKSLVDRRASVRSIRHLQPSLEEVYLSLTEASRE